jgi:hypothetical protein
MGSRETSTVDQKRSLPSVWFQATRPFSLTASVLPVVIGAVLAASAQGPVDWPLFPLIVVCSLLFHIGTNMVSDYFDYRRGVDRDETFGSSRVLLEGLLTRSSFSRRASSCLPSASPWACSWLRSVGGPYSYWASSVFSAAGSTPAGLSLTSIWPWATSSFSSSWGRSWSSAPISP